MTGSPHPSLPPPSPEARVTDQSTSHLLPPPCQRATCHRASAVRDEQAQLLQLAHWTRANTDTQAEGLRPVFTPCSPSQARSWGPGTQLDRPPAGSPGRGPGSLSAEPQHLVLQAFWAQAAVCQALDVPRCTADDTQTEDPRAPAGPEQTQQRTAGCSRSTSKVICARPLETEQTQTPPQVALLSFSPHLGATGPRLGSSPHRLPLTRGLLSPPASL